MYNLLVVDDEEISLRGIVQGIDWSSLPFANVYAAYDAAEAKAIFAAGPVHVMVSDIDMPSENGIELLAWVNAHSPQTQTIFLTGHADFKYAQQAIQLDSFDYLLKPIDHGMLKECVEKALASVTERERDEEFRKTYEYYYAQWNRQLPLLVERFWQDVLSLRLIASPGQLEPMFAMYGIPLDMAKPILPVLVSVEEWKAAWSARDEEIMTYALKNAAADIMLAGQDGHVIQDQTGLIFALLYDPPPATIARLEERSREYVRKCDEFLYGVVSCYIGEPVPVQQLRDSAQRLSDMERTNIRRTGSVFRLADFEQPDGMPAGAPSLPEWGALIEQGKKTELLERVEETFERLRREHVDRTYMVNFFYGLVHVVFQLLQKKSLSPLDVYPDGEWQHGEQAMRSLDAMRAWTLGFAGKAAEALCGRDKDVSATVARVMQFIADNLHQEQSREAIAEHVYLNPAYLSRLFRKETGMSITDYILELRMSRARAELEQTNHKISDIAVSVGYSNFSHFSKLFKKLIGMTPQEYRKKHQHIR